MYLLNAEVELVWKIAPTTSVIDVADLDLILVNPEGTEIYLDSAVLTVNFTAPTELLEGEASYSFTPDIEGLWTVRLVIGNSSSYTQLAKSQLQVLDNSTTTNPVATYIKTQVTSEAIKVPCVVATTENISLNGLQTINGITVQQYDRVLVKDQTDQSENGLYNVIDGVWVRTSDFNSKDNIFNGVFVLDLTEGVTYSARFTGNMDLGVTNLTFTATSVLESPLADLIDQVSYGQEWAKAPEDTHVSTAAGGGTDTDDYSALHFAAKAYNSSLESEISAQESSDSAGNALVSAQEASDDALSAQADATSVQVQLANAGSMLGINFGAFSINDNELTVTHLLTTTPSLVDGELILEYETL